MFFQLHEDLTEPLDLFVAQGAGLNAPERLAFQELAQKLDRGQDQFGQPPFYPFGIGVDPAVQGTAGPLQFRGEGLQVARIAQWLLSPQWSRSGTGIFVFLLRRPPAVCGRPKACAAS